MQAPTHLQMGGTDSEDHGIVRFIPLSVGIASRKKHFSRKRNPKRVSSDLFIKGEESCHRESEGKGAKEKRKSVASVRGAAPGDQYSPMSSFQSSGLTLMKPAISSLHSVRSMFTSFTNLLE